MMNKMMFIYGGVFTEGLFIPGGVLVWEPFPPPPIVSATDGTCYCGSVNYATVDCRCSRLNPFHMKVFLDTDGKATGDLFWDSGESIG